MKADTQTLLIRSFDEELDPSEAARLIALLEASREAREEYERLGRVRSMVVRGAAPSFDSGFVDRVMAEIPAAPVLNGKHGTDRRLERRASRGGIRGADRRGKRSLQTASIARHLAVAGSAVAILLAILSIAWWVSPRSTSVPEGEVAVVQLEDGTEIELSGGTTVWHRPFRGRSMRRVVLDGEAFFDVASDRKPFIVETFNARVAVLGTRFNVRAWRSDEEPATQVAVSEGRVTVISTDKIAHDSPLTSPADQSHPDVVTLEAGEMLTVAPGIAASPQQQAIDRVLAWRAGGLAFTDERLGRVFRTLERRFGIEIDLADPAIVNRSLTYLNPRPTAPEAVLDDICRTLDLRYRRTARGFEILAINGAAQ